MFVIDEKITEKYPDIRIGVIIAEDIENSGDSEEINKMLEEVQLEIRRDFSNENISLHYRIEKWRQVFSSFGSKPSDYRSSVEALIRSVLKGRNISHINKLVDLYNYISLKHVIPAGGEDLEKISGNVNLRFAEGNEVFVPLNSQNVDHPYAGEVIYCDDVGNVLCRRWNWRESDKTKLTEETKSCIIVLEGFDNKVEAAMQELKSLVQKFCNAKTKTFITSKENPKIEW